MNPARMGRAPRQVAARQMGWWEYFVFQFKRVFYGTWNLVKRGSFYTTSALIILVLPLVYIKFMEEQALMQQSF